MQTIIFLLLMFLIVIFSVLLYYKNKHSRVDKLNSGECPSCGSKPKIFYDQETNRTIKQDVIKAKLLNKGDCSGVADVEYQCKVCGLKEVYSQNGNSSCGV